MDDHLVCVQDVINRYGPFTVAVLQGEEMVSHISKNSALCFHFLRKRSIQSQVTRNCHYSEDLPQALFSFSV